MDTESGRATEVKRVRKSGALEDSDDWEDSEEECWGNEWITG